MSVLTNKWIIDVILWHTHNLNGSLKIQELQISISETILYLEP